MAHHLTTAHESPSRKKQLDHRLYCVREAGVFATCLDLALAEHPVPPLWLSELDPELTLVSPTVTPSPFAIFDCVHCNINRQ